MFNVLVAMPVARDISTETFKTFYDAVLIPKSHGTISIEFQRWGNSVVQRNEIIKSFLNSPAKFSHLFFMDSDMSFPQNALLKLLLRDKDVVCGIYLKKIEPFSVCAKPLNNSETLIADTSGLIEVDAAATGCMLVSRGAVNSVVEHELNNSVFAYDEIDGEFVTEDYVFCNKLKSQGYKIFIDTEVLCGHLGEAMIMPEYSNGNFSMKVSII